MSLFDFLKQPDINEGVKTFQNTPGAVLLDVRSREEYREGHIPGSINIPVGQIGTASDQMSDRNVPVFSYCLRGSRSRRAVKALRAMGYTNVTNIGGIASFRGEITR